jgi:hypothetical protein
MRPTLRLGGAFLDAEAAAGFAPSFFGKTVKKPSSRPCCLAFNIFCSRAAPLRTRSSLKGKVDQTAVVSSERSRRKELQWRRRT